MRSKMEILRKQEEEANWVKGLMVTAQKRKWYGTMTIKIKKGVIDLVKKEETMKPPKDED